MSHPSRSDLRLYERALRNGWDVPAETRAEVVRVLAEIVRDGTAKRRERTAAARALLQATRVELEAVRVAQGVLYEDLAQRLEALEGNRGGELAEAEGGD
jgi:hypothetical protein